MPTVEIGINEIELIKLWGGWLSTVDAYQIFSEKQCAKNFQDSIMQKIKHYVDEENQFTMHDEELYAAYGTVMADYQQILSLYQDDMAAIDDLKIGEILNGICDILTARLKQYEEYLEAQGESPAQQNPIEREKQDFLLEIEISIEEAMEKLKEQLFAPEGWISKEEFRQLCFQARGKLPQEAHGQCQSALYERILQSGGEFLHRIYLHALGECAQNINNLDLRRDTRFFYDGLAEEKETLDSIIKIQIRALEKEMGAGSSEGERQIVGRIVESITDAGKALTQQYEEINTAYNDIIHGQRRPQTDDLTQFTEFLQANCVKPYIGRIHQSITEAELAVVRPWLEELPVFLEMFDKRMEIVADASVDIRPYRRFVYEMRKRITDKMILTDEMMDYFKKLSAFYVENEDKIPQDSYRRIIDGIQESINIKLDVLEENKESFEAEVKEKFDGLVPPVPTEEDAEILKEKRLAIWLKRTLEGDAQDPAYVERLQEKFPEIVEEMKSVGTTERYNEVLNRQIGKEIDGFMKLENSFLKDYLLYEVGTFDEIQTYSVSKLKESEDGFAKEYAAKCEALGHAIVRLLKQHSIEVIEPQPFDQFNSAEHEVLLAEKSDEFKKGQIIKMMNAGYRYGDAVLIRANVIAAK